MAEIDALFALAEASNSHNMVRPKVLSSNSNQSFLKFIKMRHPLVEYNNKDKQFIPNDIEMDFNKSRSLLITGPNMGGKSTLLRTICLVVIMA
jgi:DNA mismatch repair ATPase MutS